MRPQIAKLRRVAQEAGVGCLLIASPENVEYFTGVKSIADSALLLLYDQETDQAELYVPLLEYYRYRDALAGVSGVEVKAVSRALRPADAEVAAADWREVVARAASRGRLGVDIDFPSPLALTIHKSVQDYVNVSDLVARERMVKEGWEIELIKEAVRVTLEGIKAVYDAARPGVTEASLAGAFEAKARSMGVEDYPFQPIVSSMPNNSYPHNTPSSKRLGVADVVVVDVGVRVGGRCSDVTRLIVVGSVGERVKKAIEAVEQALLESVDRVSPGVTAGELAKAAVDLIEKSGFGGRFIHGLGHGIGVVVHEQPYIRLGHGTRLEKNMVLTIEPGIYLPGEFGVRLEEDVLVTERGAEVLSRGLELVLYL